MTGILFLVIFVCCIAVMVLMIARFKIHPFLALLAISLVLAFAGGIGLRDITGIMGNGFSGVFGSIGIVILFGMLIGNLLEKTGAALKLIPPTPGPMAAASALYGADGLKMDVNLLTV